MNFIIYDVFYSQYYQQRVSTGNPAIFRAMVLLQETIVIYLQMAGIPAEICCWEYCE